MGPRSCATEQFTGIGAIQIINILYYYYIIYRCQDGDQIFGSFNIAAKGSFDETSPLLFHTNKVKIISMLTQQTCEGDNKILTSYSPT